MQLSMLDDPPLSPILAEYDWIVVSSSAGKDSQAMLDMVYEQAEREGVTGRVVVVHCDLGRVEWQGTRALAEQQADAYGLPLIVTGRKQGDLLTHVAQRGKWPSPRQRYCTSDHKRAQVHKVYTELASRSLRVDAPCMRHAPVRILSCMGMRAQESPARAKRPPFQRNDAASNGRRHVDDWLPLHRWTEDEVWARIAASRQRDMVHYAYKLGMPRLSCCFCIFAPKAALVLAGKHNPELLTEYVRVEQKIGHTFRVDLSMADVQAAVAAGGGEAVTNWKM